MIRDYRLELRLTKEEYEALETAVAEQTLKKSDYVRLKLFSNAGSARVIRSELILLRAEITQAIHHFKIKNDDLRYEALIESLSACNEKMSQLIRIMEERHGSNSA